MKSESTPNYKWIYTYDYPPDSVWEPWRATDGVSEWIAVEADAVARRAESYAKECRGRGGTLLTFLLLTDSHFAYNGTWDDTVAAMEALAKRMSLNGIIHLGDLTDGLLPLAQTMKMEQRCIRDMASVLESEDVRTDAGDGRPALFLTPGNHDYNYFRGNQEIRYPAQPQYYIDFPDEKLRLIFIDSFDPKEPIRYGFSEYCVHWLEATLRMMPEGYVAVVFSHVPPLVRLQAWTDNIRNREKLMAVLNQYAESILALINGHNHCDLLFNELNNGRFPIISINCAKCEYFTEHKPQGAVVPHRRLGGRTQESFDILQIDTRQREMKFTRFGAGEDRIVQNYKAIWVGEEQG